MWRTICKKELLGVIRNRWYWVACITSPLLGLLLALGGPRLLDHFTAGSWRVAYHVEGAPAAPDFISDVRKKAPGIEWTVLPLAPGAADKERLRRGELDAVLSISGETFATCRAELLTRNLGKASRSSLIGQAIRETVTDRRLAARGLTKAEVDRLLSPLVMAIQPIGGGQRHQGGDAAWIAYAIIGVILLLVMLFGTTVMTALCKEKNTKMVEVILSCASADDLIMGKVVGISSAALLQIATWGVIGYIELQIANWLMPRAALLSSLPDGQGTPGILQQAAALPPTLWLECGIFLVLGLALFVLFYAAVGAIVETPEDGQHLLMPISAAWGAPLALSFVVREAPDSTAAVVASLIPPFAPFLMPMRLTLAEVPHWQLALSLVLLAGSIWVGRRITAKIYRVGLLMTGKPPSLREMWRWLRVA